MRALDSYTLRQLYSMYFTLPFMPNKSIKEAGDFKKYIKLKRTIQNLLIMKKKKYKRFILQIAKNFPTTHSRAGEPTNFYSNIFNGTKKHTIRGNYPMWKDRESQVVKDRFAIIPLKEWSGKPYKSPQEELGFIDHEGLFMKNPLHKDLDFIIDTEWVSADFGVQRLHYKNGKFYTDSGTVIPAQTLAKNDGLSLDDFNDWFKKTKKQEYAELAIIHFTKTRY